MKKILKYIVELVFMLYSLHLCFTLLYLYPSQQFLHFYSEARAYLDLAFNKNKKVLDDKVTRQFALEPLSHMHCS